MTFSFFGKKPPAAKPMAQSRMSSQFRANAAAQRGGVPGANSAEGGPDALDEDGGLQLEIGVAGIEPCIEHAAILYAADHPVEARAVLEAALAQGDAPEQSWLMLLELYELAGDGQRCRALAQKYTLRFRKPPPPPRPAVVAEHHGPRLSGQIVAAATGSFDFLLAPGGAELEIDASGLQRIDFVSAGILLNTVLALQQKGRRVRIRQLGHLVAGLLASVGMGRVAVLETRQY